MHCLTVLCQHALFVLMHQQEHIAMHVAHCVCSVQHVFIDVKEDCLTDTMLHLPAATTTSSVQFVTGSNGQPTSAILTGIGAQATFQNTAGQVIVVTSNSAGTVTIPIDSSGDPTIPSGAGLTVVSNDPSIPSTSSTTSTTGQSLCIAEQNHAERYAWQSQAALLNIQPSSICHSHAQ